MKLLSFLVMIAALSFNAPVWAADRVIAIDFEKDQIEVPWQGDEILGLDFLFEAVFKNNESGSVQLSTLEMLMDAGSLGTDRLNLRPHNMHALPGETQAFKFEILRGSSRLPFSSLTLTLYYLLESGEIKSKTVHLRFK